MKIHCKCHGITGTCSFKTCFRRLGDFREISKFLRKKYDRIVYVKINKKKKRQERKRKNEEGTKKKEKKEKKTIRLKSKNGRKYNTKDLIAVSRSPSYCKRMLKRGSYGTKGRICDPKKKRGKGGCNYMCCGRGFRRHVIKKKERCECVLVWCCKVKCKTCTKREVISRCKWACSLDDTADHITQFNLSTTLLDSFKRQGIVGLHVLTYWNNFNTLSLIRVCYRKELMETMLGDNLAWMLY